MMDVRSTAGNSWRDYCHVVAPRQTCQTLSVL
jgi:hypothetical protein